MRNVGRVAMVASALEKLEGLASTKRGVVSHENDRAQLIMGGKILGKIFDPHQVSGNQHRYKTTGFSPRFRVEYVTVGGSGW